MNLFFICLICLIFLIFFFPAYAENYPNQDNFYPKYAPDEVIVKLKLKSNDTLSLHRLHSLIHNIQLRSMAQMFPETPELSSIYLLKLPKNSDLIGTIETYRQSELVEYAEPNYLRHTCENRENRENRENGENLNDFWYKKQWGLLKIRAPEAWKLTRGSLDVIVAVIDTGVDYKHQDLVPNLWRNAKEIPNNQIDDDKNGYVDDVRGWDFADAEGIDGAGDYLERDNDPMDESGHGTHVSGIIAAIPNNRVGVAGITWNCKVMALRAGFKRVGFGGSLEDDDIASAMIYAVNNGARIINMSFGEDSSSFLLSDVIDYAYRKNCVLVAAAGNEKFSFPLYPAAYDKVIAVGASDKDDSKAKFSNYGSGIDIVAPGVRIYSTVTEDSYSDWSGTSMAAPHVAAVAALMLSKRRSLNNQEIRGLLLSSADKISDPLFSGAGRLNALKALSMSDSLVAKIIEPTNENNSGADQSLQIRGDAFGLNFVGYQLEYGHSTTPNRWISITPLIKKEKYSSPMEAWDVSKLVEGVYTLRLKAVSADGKYAYDKVIIHIDHTPPKVEEVEISDRLHGLSNRFFIIWTTDEPAKSSIFYRAFSSSSKSEFKELSSAVISEGHLIELSDLLPSGKYEFFISAENRSALKSIDDNQKSYYKFELRRYVVNSDGFEKFGASLPIEDLASRNADFDSDGFPELVGMKSGGVGYAPVVIYERQESGAYFQRFTSLESYRPWAVADVDGDGLLEVLGNKEDVTFLLEAPTNGAYPTHKIWESKGIWGGQIADLDKDGKLEIISKNVKTDEIFIYETIGDNQFFNVAQLPNPTLGDNDIGTRFAVADFDGDGKLEIAAGDGDGDFFAYENLADNSYKLTWMDKTAVSDSRTVLSGDLDGDGKPELIIGSRDNNGDSGSINQRWVYSIYKSKSIADDSFQLLSQQEFMFPRPGLTGAAAGDVDGDDVDELFVAATPNAYLFKLQSERLVAIWHSTCDNTPHPIIADIDGDGGGDKEVIFNQNSELVFFKRGFTANLPKRPWGIEASQIGESEVLLRWQYSSGSFGSELTKFNLYRGLAQNDLKLYISQIAENEIVDSKIEAGVTYWYALSTIGDDGRESAISSAVSIQLNPPPKLISAKYIPPSQLILDFDQPMSNSALETSRYRIDGELDTPSSATFDSSERRVLLTLKSEPFSGSHLLTVKGINSKLKAPISKAASSISFNVEKKIEDRYENLKSVLVYPNPAFPNSQHFGVVAFDHLPDRAKISIYDLQGTLIEKLEVDESDRGVKRWHLTNSSSSLIASGVYIYVIERGDERKTGKIAIVK